MSLNYTYYTDNLPDNVAGWTKGPVIAIRNKYKDDVGVYKHELVHVNQFYILWLIFSIVVALVVYLLNLDNSLYQLAILGFGTHSILYTVSNKYRLWSEVQAYREQLKYYPEDRTELFGSYISENYKLNISKEDVVLLLKE